MHPNLPRLAVAGLLALLINTGTATMSLSEEPRPARTVSVSATGTVSAEPDQAVISIGVVSEGATASAALVANKTAMAKLIEGLKSAGIAAKDIQTTAFNVSPRHQDSKERRTATIIGYTVNNQVRILVRALDSLGQILDTAVTLGANRTDGIQFLVSAAETLTDEARRQAMTNALRRAKLFATAGGAEVGEILSIVEQNHAPGPRFVGASSLSAAPVPIEHGSQTLGVTVNVTWTLK